MSSNSKKLRIALLCPHMFMQKDILPNVIFSPGELAISLANGLVDYGHEVTIFSPGPVESKANNMYENVSLIEVELKQREYGYQELLKKHPLLFISMARQVQSNLIAKAFHMANKNLFDIVHVYMNEEEIALAFSELCNVPVVFTHHDPFNYLAKYRSNLPLHKNKNWISISNAQQEKMPEDTNWIATIHHGLNPAEFAYSMENLQDYLLFIGRIIKPKGLHLAIKAVQEFNQRNNTHLTLKIAGKHYSSKEKNNYWKNEIEPFLNTGLIEFIGFLSDKKEKNDIYKNALATIMPSTWDEPFGMVAIESLASGTPIIGFKKGALPEIIDDSCGLLVNYEKDNDARNIERLCAAISSIKTIKRKNCRAHFESNFTTNHMIQNHVKAYSTLLRL